MSRNFVSMEAFLERLHGLAGGRFDCGETLAFLNSTLIEPQSLERYLHWIPGHYTRNLVHKSETFELMALCWDIGQESKVHGHEGEKCWARVERGRLRFCNYAENAPRRGDRVSLVRTGRTLDGEPGHVDGPADIHSVANPKEFGARAVSLHLYCYPFSECEIFDLQRGTVSRMALDYDSVDGKPLR